MESTPVLRDPLRKSVIGRLLKGRDSMTRLQTLLQKPLGETGSGLAKELVMEAERSFSESIDVLNDCEINELSQIGGGKRAAAVDRSSKGSDNGKKRSGFKDRRGCYRRRNSAQSWITVSPTTEDGYAWRKYGQKEILNTKFPRCYFRCTHKHDQSCKATRQVQRVKEEPHLYQITYFGHHTCQNTLMRTPQIMISPDLHDEPMEAFILSFGTPPSKNNTINQRPRPAKEEAHSDVTDSKSCLGSSMWHDIATDSRLEGSNTNSASGVYNSNNNNNNEQEVVSGVHSCSSTPMPLQDLDMAAFGTKFGDLDDQDLYSMDGDMEMF